MGEFDVIVIGGGINGAGIAREAAQRGLKVALFEKEDFGDATTAASSRLIHGGLRYLEHGDFGLVRESLRERGVLLKTAPHLVRAVPFLVPVYRKRYRYKFWQVDLGLTIYDLLSRSSGWSELRILSRHQKLSKKKLLEMEPSLKEEGLLGGLLYYDGQVTYPERLCLENILAAAQHGALVRNYARVTGFVEERGRVCGVRVQDELNGKTEEIRASVVINATGPWVDSLCSLLPKNTPLQQLKGVKGSHLVLASFKGKSDKIVYTPALKDGRPFFVIPWDGRLLVGTTEAGFKGESLEGMAASPEEIDYLLNEVNALFDTAYGKADILYTYAGVRPLPVSHSNKPDNAVTRRHFIVDHGIGLISILGGKLTTYRSLSCQVVDLLKKKGPTRGVQPSLTHRMPLRGATLEGGTADWASLEKQWPKSLAEEYGVEQEQVSYLMQVYGTRTAEVLFAIKSNPVLRERLCPQQPDIAAQVEYAVKQERVARLGDFLLRRTGMGLRACRGLDCAAKVSALMGGYLGWDQARQQKEVADYRELIEKKYKVS